MKESSLNKEILNIALPSIVTNITVPLLGLVDVAIVGHMGNSVYIGAIAIGGMLFNILYWLFVFLRMGTSGLTAQAYGMLSPHFIKRHLYHYSRVALLIGVSLLLFQLPLRWLAMNILAPPPDILPLSIAYFNICIWGAPATLLLYVMTGWFIGVQDTRTPMFISIFQNVINIVASLILVFVMGMKVEGVAFGTIIAQYSGLLFAIVMARRRLHCIFSNGINGISPSSTCTSVDSEHVQEDSAENIKGRRGIISRVSSFLWSVEFTLFLRTLCLVAVNTFFVRAGASGGATILAVNALLMQLFTLYSYVMDGFANAGEAIAGKYYGAGNQYMLDKTVMHLFGWGVIVAFLFTLCYAIGGEPFLSLLTDDNGVIKASGEYYFWALAIPVAGLGAFVWDGVFVGVTATRAMFLSMLPASISFFAVYLLLGSTFHNHALWLAFITYLAMRGLVQTVEYRKTGISMVR